ncbi:MAG: dihydromethanopterin reductase (acceptor) [Candidatus Hydrothermarchaeota archaeon]
MRLAWCITGAGHFLKDTFDEFSVIKKSASYITIFMSRAGEEVVRIYGLEKRLNEISDGSYMNEIFRESEEGASSPITGRLALNRYDAVVVSPTTSNTIAKVVNGIADTLVTNIISQAGKSRIPVIVVPVDVEKSIKTKLPYRIERELCKCEICEIELICEKNAIKNRRIDLNKCIGCGKCLICPNNAVRVNETVEVYLRKIDAENLEKLKRMENIYVLNSPSNIKTFLSNVV